MNRSRRQFLKRTLGTTAACGLARFTKANDSPPEPITDTHVYLGHWPHQQLSSDDPPKLIAGLRSAGVTQAWTGNFDGLFHKDIASVNQRLADTCTRFGAGVLLPFGTINPTLPDWEDDLRRCQETFHMPGIRLHPNYHGYTLNDPRFAKLLELAARRSLTVQLVVWMEAERHLWLNPHQTETDLKPLAAKVSAVPRLRLVVTSCPDSSHGKSIRALLKNENVYVDFARADGSEGIRQLIDATSPKRVVFGSCAPLHNVETQVSKFGAAELAPEVRHQITSANAAALLARPQKTSSTVLENPGREIVSTQ